MSFFFQTLLIILVSLIKSYLDTNLDTYEENLDTFWILLRAPSDTWPPLHLATELVDPVKWKAKCQTNLNTETISISAYMSMPQ